MTLEVYSNPRCLGEKQYVVHQILDGFLGLRYTLVVDEAIKGILIANGTKKVNLNDDFFQQVTKEGWLAPSTLPSLPLQNFHSSVLNIKGYEARLPILYGNNNLSISKDSVELGLDVFGSCFFMLSRYEEMVCKDMDDHGRFPASSSVAFKEGLLSRPLVDEYVELLWEVIHMLWPDLERKSGKIHKYISCDVDHIEDKGVRFPGIIKRLGADLLVRRSFKACLRSVRLFFQVSILQKGEKDPFNTFDFMMDVCERQNLKMAFYFIPRNNKKKIDGEYDIESREIKVLMRKILSRGHEVGYHGSYFSYKDKEMTLAEVRALREVYKSVGGKYDQIQGGRQHYLRWRTGITEKNIEAAGLEYDTTLGYPETIGFRSGTSREYQAYDLAERKTLDLKIRPLLVMDVSLLSDKYMGLSYEAAFDEATRIWEKAKRYNGNFTLLWHNSYLENSDKKNLFGKLIGLA